MEIEVFGAAKEVTGSCYEIIVGEEKILVDCGMFQGSEELEKLNQAPLGFNPREIKALALTHAHLDHCGRIPLLVKKGFRGRIYCTDATKALAQIVMLDSAHIALEDTKTQNKLLIKKNLPQVKPIYTPAHVEQAMKLFFTVKYDENVRLVKNIYAKFSDAGHILGASSVQLTIKDGNEQKTIVFSGDIGQKDPTLVKNIKPIQKADYIFMESTYGDRLHDPRDKRKKELLRVIKETYAKGGKLFIPSFAVERTQDLLYLIGQAMEDKEIPRMPVFLDSPMAIRATDVFRKFPRYYNEEVQSKIKNFGEIFKFPELTMTTSRAQSIQINGMTEPCIVIAGNGMCTAGRIKHHITNNIEDPTNTLLFVGYQVKGTTGNLIQNGQKKINILGKELKVKAKIESIEGFSAHADKIDLQNWLKNFSPKPKKVFITHGDFSQQKALSKTLTEKGYESYIPGLNEKIEL
jgi:metallo-beta-lactamase family protein